MERNGRTPLEPVLPWPTGCTPLTLCWADHGSLDWLYSVLYEDTARIMMIIVVIPRIIIRIILCTENTDLHRFPSSRGSGQQREGSFTSPPVHSYSRQCQGLSTAPDLCSSQLFLSSSFSTLTYSCSRFACLDPPI